MIGLHRELVLEKSSFCIRKFLLVEDMGLEYALEIEVIEEKPVATLAGS